MDVVIVIVLALVGIILLMVEIFLIPGVTVAGIAGGLFTVAAFCFAFSKLGAMGGFVSLIVYALAFALCFFWLIKSKALDTIALKTGIESKIATGDAQKIHEGDKGVALSRLNLMGKVRVNGVTMEAKSLGEFIDEGSEIVVVKVTETQLVVVSSE